MQRVLIASLAVLALAACSKPVDKAAESATPATDTASTAAATAEPAADGPAAEVPHPKAGLWEVTTTVTPAMGPGGAGGARPIKYCVDGSNPVRLGTLGRGAPPPGCEPHATQGAGGAINFSTTCTMGPGIQIASRGTMSGDVNSAYTVHVESDVSGAPMPQMNGHRVTDVNAKLLGPCPAGMNPGDIQTADGRIMNPAQIAEMMGARRGAGGGGGAAK